MKTNDLSATLARCIILATATNVSAKLHLQGFAIPVESAPRAKQELMFNGSPTATSPIRFANETPVPQGRTLEQRFHQLVEEWRCDTTYVSSISQLTSHPAYQEIVGLGKAALPLILKELERQTDHWFPALYAITSENPVAPENAGDIEEMRLAWLNWGRINEYV